MTDFSTESYFCLQQVQLEDIVTVVPSTRVPRLTGDGTLYSDGIIVVAKCLHVRVVISSSQLSLVSKVFF